MLGAAHRIVTLPIFNLGKLRPIGRDAHQTLRLGSIRLLVGLASYSGRPLPEIGHIRHSAFPQTPAPWVSRRNVLSVQRSLRPNRGPAGIAGRICRCYRPSCAGAVGSGAPPTEMAPAGLATGCRLRGAVGPGRAGTAGGGAGAAAVCSASILAANPDS